MLAYLAIALALGFLALYLLKRNTTQPFTQPQPLKPSESAPKAKNEEKPAFGRVRIYFGTQTGTAAKLSEQLAE